MFLMYDLNMNEIEFPEGFIPLDIFISSIDKERVIDKVEGGNRKLNYGSTYNERDIHLSILLKAHDTQDYRLLRDETYALFNKYDTFYLVEKYQRGKRHLVSVDEKFIPDRIPGNQRYADATINCITTELPFAESVGTSMDIHTPINLISNQEWEQGYRTHDVLLDIPYAKHIKDLLPIPDFRELYVEISDSDEYGAVIFSDDGLVFKFDKSGSFSFNTSSKDYRLNILKKDGTPIEDDVDIDSLVKMYEKGTGPVANNGLSYSSGLWSYGMGLLYENESHVYIHNAVSDKSFRIYNPSNIPMLHPFECELKIKITNVVGSDDMFQITNHTNGSRARVNIGLAPSDEVVYDQHMVTRNDLNILRDTRRDFIWLSPGWNTLQVYFCDSATIEFDFPFYYL